MPKDRSRVFKSTRRLNERSLADSPQFIQATLQLGEDGRGTQQQDARYECRPIPETGSRAPASKAWIACAPFSPTSPAPGQRSHLGSFGAEDVAGDRDGQYQMGVMENKV